MVPEASDTVRLMGRSHAKHPLGHTGLSLTALLQNNRTDGWRQTRP